MRDTTRNHAFVPATVGVLDGGLLRLANDKGPPRTVPLAEVAEVRLSFAPTRPEPRRYRCRLTLRSGVTLKFFNRTYRGVYDFSDTSAAYVAFVQALHAAIVQYAPDCRFAAGADSGAYALNWAAMVFVGLMIRRRCF